MGLFEIFEMIFEAIVGFIGGLFISNSVTFGTPPTATNGTQVKKVNSSNYTVNKNTTVSFDLEIKGYKSYKTQLRSGTTGGYATASSCKKVSDDGQKVSFSISTNDKNARNVKVIAYETDNCKEDSKEYTSPSVSYKAPTTSVMCTFNYGGVQYSGACDKSNGAYKRIGTQGPKTCNCYSKAYGIAMVLNRIVSPPNTNGMSDENAWDTALNCWDFFWAGNYYLTNDIVESETRSGIFDLIREELKDTGRPVMVYVSTKNGSSHFFLATAIKTSSLNKAKSDLSYSDFYILDPYYNGTASTSIPPVEKNWQERISGNYGKLITSSARHNNYYITKFQK